MDKENFIINEISIKKNLHHINNFSNYTISLISDIIQYASNSADIRFNNIEIYLRDAMEFTFNVLKILVECNENKVKMIETLMKIDEKIESLKVFTDEIRLRQILLNLFYFQMLLNSQYQAISKSKLIILIKRLLLK